MDQNISEMTKNIKSFRSDCLIIKANEHHHGEF